MFMTQPGAQTVPASGDPSAKIAIVGEAPAKFELIKGKPFVGPAGGVLETCLHTAGLTRAECYITNLANYQTKGEKLYNDRRDALTPEGEACAERLRAELEQSGANVVVPMGRPAACAVTGTGKISRVRGYLFDSVLVPGRKAVPTIHPAATLRGNFIQRHYIVHDLVKVKLEAEYPELRFPEDPIWTPKNFDEAKLALENVLETCHKAGDYIYLSVDIETNNHEVSFFGISVVEAGKVKIAISIPMYSSSGPPWTEQEEVYLWQLIAKILRTETHKLFQNGIFDIFFLIQRVGIYTAGRVDDTMVGHHILYPDFLKSLEFLGSIYSHRVHWKGWVSHKVKDKMKVDD